MFGIPLGRLLIASVIAGIFAISGALIAPTEDHTMSNIEVVANASTIKLGETFKVNILVDAVEPVNVFKGLLHFDNNKLVVTSIDYNVSIADLWAEEPWFSNGDGTLGFIGGTTRVGGFVGRDSIITVTFMAKEVGETQLKVTDVTLLRHDGLGSEAQVGQPIDSIFTIENPQVEIKTGTSDIEKKVFIVTEPKPTDLNGDGEQSISDVSIFMGDLTQNNLRSDFNGDGRVSLKDLSILMQ